MSVGAQDLTTVAAVNDWLGQDEATDAAIIQRAITGLSQKILTMTGRSSLNSAESYTERYDGNGRDSLLLRNYPILSVSSLSVSGQVIQESPDYISPGWVIDTQGEANTLRIIGNANGSWGPFNGWGWDDRSMSCLSGTVFSRGVMNVAITYTAGYSATPPDLAQAVTVLVADNYRSKQWLAQVSVAQPGIGNVTYSRLSIPPQAQDVIKLYKRGYTV